MSNVYEDLKVIQIIPAAGHIAVYADTDWKEGAPDARPSMTQPVICWALTERECRDGVDTHVVGLVCDHGSGELIVACEVDEFLGYVESSTRKEEIDKMCLGYLKAKKPEAFTS